ncbi:MaoC/PaaZ C-terminal domain-containing protein [Cryobacterium sp. Y57]|uniref:MaoC/PaaZ C-terminal domain-containing protein n=1 Tax=Cryobacterium sp. Y57 TaxID=2048287 RepID=UPI000CE37EDA|nr:MaoC/PaaZ C-terminal domain-containing protein [Cryobacterium sp. Y57]
MISKPFEDIKVADISTTDSRTITEDYVRAFGELTGDKHPLHMNPQYARDTRFGKQIAHGALMISTLLGLVEMHPSYLLCFYSLDNVKFKAPSYFGDSVSVVCEILAVDPRKDGDSAIVTSAAKLINHDGVVVLTGDFSLLVAGRASALAEPIAEAKGVR